MLFFTGMTRSARDILSRQKASMQDNWEHKRPALRKMCEIARQLRDVLISGRNLNDFGKLLHEAWEAKRSLEPDISNAQIDDYYQRGLRAGALGGKLLGAGGGGFLLFFFEPNLQDQFRAEL